MTRIVLAVIVALWSSLVAAQAVPEWALGRNGSNQLQVDGGVLGTVTFASEYAGTDPSDTENPGCTPTDRVSYDRTYDGYEGRPFGSCLTNGSCTNNANYDLYHPVWQDTRHRHVLIKNIDIKNAFKTISGPHVDVTQVLDSPGWGGWFAIQDSILKNSDDGLTQWQFGYTSGACGSFGGQSMSTMGGVLVQGLTLGHDAGFDADCAVRAAIVGDPCTYGNYWGTWSSSAVLWIINLDNSGWPITLQQTWAKVVTVGTIGSLNTGNGGGGAFGVTTACTGSPCSHSNQIWGPYANIEAAIAAGHAEPPFARLSCSGWASPPAGCVGGGGGGSAPSAPTNFRFTAFDDWLQLAMTY